MAKYIKMKVWFVRAVACGRMGLIGQKGMDSP